MLPISRGNPRTAYKVCSRIDRQYTVAYVHRVLKNSQIVVTDGGAEKKKKKSWYVKMHSSILKMQCHQHQQAAVQQQ